MQIVEETVTYGWSQGTSPYLVVTIYSKRPPCLNFAVYTGYMLPRRLRRLDALLLLRTTNNCMYTCFDLMLDTVTAERSEANTRVTVGSNLS